MATHDHSGGSHTHSRGFWRSRSGVALILFLAVAGFLLAYEHRVHVLTTNGILIGLLALCVGVHFFMHGGHGGHDGSQSGHHDGRRGTREINPSPSHDDGTTGGDSA